MVFPLPIEAVSLQSRTCPGKETDSLHQPCRNPAHSLSALITERPVYHPDHPLGLSPPTKTEVGKPTDPRCSAEGAGHRGRAYRRFEQRQCPLLRVEGDADA